MVITAQSGRVLAHQGPPRFCCVVDTGIETASVTPMPLTHRAVGQLNDVCIVLRQCNLAQTVFPCQQEPEVDLCGGHVEVGLFFMPDRKATSQRLNLPDIQANAVSQLSAG